MGLTQDTKLTLNNGVKIPVLGLGTYLSSEGERTKRAILEALAVGYRHFDTAAFYRNEKTIGAAITESGIDREEVFVTTKLWNDDHGYDSTLAAFDASLDRLGLDYVDLYLIHFPVQRLRLESWRALENLLDKGRCRAIGVSNYMQWHLQELLDNGTVTPTINQVEFHPFLYQKELLDFCNSRDIQLEAYSPLTKGRKLSDQRLIAMGEKYQKTVAQILIRWSLQHNLVVIPKSSNLARIRENAEVFDFSISKEDMESLNGLHENFRSSWDPSRTP
ncbi:MAG: aldo/keto reductase [Candidatus Thorarchaeota archaeon]